MEGVWRISPPGETESARPRIDRDLARLAEGQHGIVTQRQLGALGLGPSGARGRVARGSLHRIHPGVYSVGHSLLRPEGRWLAAVAACGANAVLSHRSAAALLALRASSRTRIDVCSPRRRGRGLDGIDVHSGATLKPADVTEVDGIPCTSVARTLLDLAELVPRPVLDQACRRAEQLRLFDGAAIAAVLSRAQGRRGAPALAAALSDLRDEGAPTRSELEDRFVALCEAAGIVRPEINARVPVPGGSLEVDFLWREARLIVETDGRRFHTSSADFERDHERQQLLVLAQWRVLACTWRQVTMGPGLLAARMREMLRCPTTPAR